MQNGASMRAIIGLAAAAAFGISSAPARADDAAALAALFSAAADQVTSFVVEMRVNGTTGVGGSTTFVRPMRMKSEFAVGEIVVQTFLVDGVLYVHSPVAGWQKAPLDGTRLAQQSPNVADKLKQAKITPLSDRVENGITVGVVRMELPIPMLGSGLPGAKAPGTVAPNADPAGQLLCTYDKATYRMRECSSAALTLTYTRYNDPANAVVLPPEAKAAAPMVLPSLDAPSAAPPAVPARGQPAQAPPAPAVPPPSPSAAPTG